MNKILKKLDKQAYEEAMLKQIKKYLNELVHEQELTFDQMSAAVSKFGDFRCVMLERFGVAPLAFITYDVDKKKVSTYRTPIPDKNADKILAKLSE